MIGLLSFYTESYEELAKLTLPIKQRYCDKNNYQHIVVGNGYGDKSRYYSWQRIEYTLDYFKSHPECEALFTLNIQNLIMNHNRRIEEFMDDKHDFFVTFDINGLNAGSYIIKNTPWGNKWMQFILDSRPQYDSHCWHEQFGISCNWEKPEWKPKIKILEHPSINSYDYTLYNKPESTLGHFRPGDFVLSLPGTSLVERLVMTQSDKIKSQIIY